MTRARIAGVGLVLLALLAGEPGIAEDPPAARRALAALGVLVVSPAAAEGHGVWVETLLRESGARVERVGWTSATVEHARGFDLVVVTGPRRRVCGAEVLSYDRPVLGIGSYGHVVFGRSRLKHGSPFS